MKTTLTTVALVILGLVLTGGRGIARSTITTITVPGSISTSVSDINAFDSVVGAYFDSSGDGVAHGFLSKAGRFQTIDPPGSVYTVLSGINSFGVIAETFDDADYNRHGFIRPLWWFADADLVIHGFLLDRLTTIQAPDSNDTETVAINGLGHAAGFYFDNAFVSRGFIAVP